MHSILCTTNFYIWLINERHIVFATRRLYLHLKQALDLRNANGCSTEVQTTRVKLSSLLHHFLIVILIQFVHWSIIT